MSTHHSWLQPWLNYKQRMLSMRPANHHQLAAAYASLIAEPEHRKANFHFDSCHDLAHAIANAPSGRGPYFYSAADNPTTVSLEDNLAHMETYPLARIDDHYYERVRCLAFSCGSAAITATLVHIAGLLGPKERSQRCLIMGEELFEASIMAAQFLENQDIEIRQFAPDASGLETLIKDLESEGKDVCGVYIESPTNKGLRVYPIRKIACVTTSRRIPLIVDNSLPTPYLQQPMLEGADIVVYSTTKYLNGHGDLLGGAVVGPYGFIRPEQSQLKPSLFIARRIFGSIPSPADTSTVNGHLHDLPARMMQHCTNTSRIAKYLSRHPRIKRVIYPGLPQDPEHANAASQMRAYGGILLAEHAGKAEQFINKLRRFKHAVSYGEAQSLALINARTGMIRFAIGRENSDDLIADLAQALRRP